MFAGQYIHTNDSEKRLFLGVNAENGGRLGLRDARISSKDRKFIKRENNGQIYYANGMTFDGVINFTYMNSSKADDSPALPMAIAAARVRIRS